ncbi:MAG TPA: HEAT repeat domain-containing protein, partial [Nitrospiraceae bacterium]|nr:HEAT repeat domain-containing protein [Nitrospiraceae bacterium]
RIILFSGGGKNDPEIISVKALLKLLDKAAKSARTYGAANPVAKRFFDQFYDDLSKHLETYGRLPFVVQRSELYFKDHVVYQPDRDATGESIAFKMYADGIRELAFCEGLSREDLSFFLEALWDHTNTGDSSEADDDDIVTRLWARDLTTITVVTAEELVRSSSNGMDALEPHVKGLLDAPVSSLREILDRERARRAAGAPGTKGEGAPGEASHASSSTAAGESSRRSLQPNVVGYEVSQDETSALAAEIKEECGRDSTMYIIDMLTAILASETSAALLTKLFEVWGGVIESLIRNGQWTVLETVLAMLQDTDAVRPDLSPGHKQQVAALLNALGRPEHIKLIENYLNKAPRPHTEGLLTLLLSMKKEIVPALCALLANLESPAHQSIVVEALATVAKDNADPIVRGLGDKRPAYVRHLLNVIGKWNDPRLADPVEKAIRHPEPQVRKDALRLLAHLRPSGSGVKIVGLLNDPDETVRLTAMKLLSTGHYTAPFQCWSPFITTEEFHERSSSEKRAIFQAMRHTAGDEAVPFWQTLLTEWSWTNRKKREELAVMAADTLGKLASSAAVAALEAGQKKGNAAVRQA